MVLQKYRLIDTAGIRKRAAVASAGSTTEALSVNRALRAICRSDVVALVIEAMACITEQVFLFNSTLFLQNRIIAAVGMVEKERSRRLGTSVLNQVVQEALAFKPPPRTRGGKRGRVYYSTQVGYTSTGAPHSSVRPVARVESTTSAGQLSEERRHLHGDKGLASKQAKAVRRKNFSYEYVPTREKGEGK
ncbi:hypothetical protein BHE74_00026140 [Ensete ventricosum]|nr:hypothetical protein BHE74_00026140 [Ensete ventricosum]